MGFIQGKRTGAAPARIHAQAGRGWARPAITRRGFCAVAGAGVLAALGLSGCVGGGSGSASGGAQADAGIPELTAEPEQRDFLGSPDAVDVRVGTVIGPPAMGLTQFMLAAEADKTFNRFAFDTTYAVDYSGLAAAFNQGDFDICVLPSNIGPILFNNDELKNSYKVISVNNLGVLYVMTTDPGVNSFEDLAGRTVYAYGAGGTPEYTIQSLLLKLGLADTFTVEFKSTPFEILNLMQDVPNAVAILPQPFVALSETMVEGLRVPIDLTVEWNRAFADTGSQAVTTTTLVNTAFLEEHEQAVAEYLNMVGQSVSWTLANMEQAAALQERLGTFLSNDVALAAMPHIAMVNLCGLTMRDALSGFLEELYRANPDSIGGAVPGDEFYYLPPVGAVEDEAVGLEEAANER